MEPLSEDATASIMDSDAEALEAWYQSGLDAIARGEVAVVLMGEFYFSLKSYSFI